MIRMRYKAHAKINLGLEVLEKRPDGYHEIRTVYQSIALADALEFHPARDITLGCSDPSLPTDERNLVVRAALKLQEVFRVKAGARIRLTKRIPQQAGLGGGSSDAAATLLALNRLWKLDASAQDLDRIAASLGSDVPFFLVGGTALGVGRGEEVYPLPDAPASNLVLAWPERGMSTKEAYGLVEKELTEAASPHRIQNIVRELLKTSLWEGQLFNRFEEVFIESQPDESEAIIVREALQHEGASRVLLAGSGAAWVGFFPDRPPAQEAYRKLMLMGHNAVITTTLTSKDYWRETLPG
ncbi:MAG: 4-(cytidine 5'-diphospho)-2-C-methyl-D-erythritol kinase [Acidobacteriota bacterium]|jgi:4-diphosphocytidyl-2-C-methyl-D-erythritol kinase